MRDIDVHKSYRRMHIAAQLDLQETISFPWDKSTESLFHEQKLEITHECIAFAGVLRESIVAAIVIASCLSAIRSNCPMWVFEVDKWPLDERQDAVYWWICGILTFWNQRIYRETSIYHNESAVLSASGAISNLRRNCQWDRTNEWAHLIVPILQISSCVIPAVAASRWCEDIRLTLWIVTAIVIAITERYQRRIRWH